MTMKTDFSINVQVSLGLTPGLERLVKALMAGGHGGGTAMAQDTPAEPEGETAETAARSEDAAQTQEAQGPAGPTEEDVRAAMHRARQRIEGEDYKEHTDGEPYKKYHKPLTAEFKRMASLLGADKPSALGPEQRAAFIRQCDELQVMDNGTVGCATPF